MVMGRDDDLKNKKSSHMPEDTDRKITFQILLAVILLLLIVIVIGFIIHNRPFL